MAPEEVDPHARALVGRDSELATILDVAEAGSAWTAVVAGPAGIGKTALWEAAKGALPAPAWLLQTRSRDTETRLAFAGLTDLLDPVPDAVIDDLPGPQRDALAAAILRAGAGEPGVDSRAVATGLRNLFARLAERGSVVLALDDVQWLDQASREALEFAVHRCPVGLLVAVRDPAGPVPVAAASTVPVTRVDLGPLSVAALHHLVLGATGRPLTRPALVRVAEASGGNPLFAIELARALPRLPTSLTSALAERVAQLSADAQRTVLAVALAAAPTVALLRAADCHAGIDEAEAAGLLRVATGRVELHHPLVGPAAVDRSPAPVVRAVHAALARALADDEERAARHLALASTEPDDAVAAALDRAVEATRSRGAAFAAADLARLAVEHSAGGDPDLLLRRTLALAGLTFEEGDAAEAERLFRSVREAAGAPDLRATAALELAEILWKRGEIDECVEAARWAAAAGAGPEVTARAHLTLVALGDDREANTQRAMEVLDAAGVDDPLLRSWAEFAVLDNEFGAGRGLDVPALEAALAAERTGRAWRSDDQVATCRPALLKYADHAAAARAALDQLRERAEAEGNVGQLIYVVRHYPTLLLRMGELAAAEAATEEHLDLATTTGQTNHLWQAQENRGWVALHAGRIGEAVEVVATLPSVLQSDTYAERAYRALAGALAVVQGDAEAAARHLDAWWQACLELGDDPGVSRGHGDYAEALVAVERYDDCRVFLDVADAAARRAGRVSVHALVARGRAMLAARLGELDEALTWVEAAVRLDDEVPIALEGARHRLLEGRLHRRRKEKLLARESLEQALAGFEAVGAAWWAERARAELARVNIRPAAPTTLTASEQRIAELAAGGLTTRQIAEAAFVSPKTVEANLTRIYRKLGIRSRAELVARLPHVEGTP
ncbi:LuxR family transcriptional regulator [Nocardioides immobilis]|uniref:LuxR family transcriptional regulator n=1 Tax=Nocardioides immobilis TaxID=2049295 RepID=A0A417Y402_9ACTN|nr:LuxR family transcriptional regulator [Nocardioides immobilis]RHW27398.1 LuxR family transcriptional regulator [Nocardioides immobilis]